MDRKTVEKANLLADLKRMSLSELCALSVEVRKFIVDVISVNGGHLSSNLGIVDVTIALHRVFESPKDVFIFDTSHQTYAHKILTNRNSAFKTIRKFGGVSGFSSPQESEHDPFALGHAGTAISLGLGVAHSRDLEKRDNHVVAIIGDASFGCGLTLEGLNNISADLKKFVIVLNDNAMAISGGVGNIHEKILGTSMAREFFNGFGVDYVGVVDGHNLESLLDVFDKAKNCDRPLLIHVKTKKGLGLPKAMEDPTKYHGVSPFDPESGKFFPSPCKCITFPMIFGKQLVKMASRNDSVAVITPAMKRGSCLDEFARNYPHRCFDVGIAEGHAVTFAGGLSYKFGGKIFACIYSSFFQRSFDNFFHDICLQKLPVTFALDRGGISAGDGTTHHGIFDISFVSAMPNVIIAQPRDGDLFIDLLESSVFWKNPSVIRYPNMGTNKSERCVIDRVVGRGEVLVQGRDLVFITLGHMHKLAYEARDILLNYGIEATIVDPIFVKPLDKNLIKSLMNDHNYFVTIEEHSVVGGFGSIINSFIVQECERGDIKVKNFGIPDKFLDHGSYEELMDSIGLTPISVATQILDQFFVKQTTSEVLRR